VQPSNRCQRKYDIFFGRRGTFLADFQNTPEAANETAGMPPPAEFEASMGLRQILRQNFTQILPNRPGAFIFETDHRCVLASFGANHFATLAESSDLEEFLNISREVILNYITEEAIRFQTGGLRE